MTIYVSRNQHYTVIYPGVCHTFHVPVMSLIIKIIVKEITKFVYIKITDSAGAEQRSIQCPIFQKKRTGHKMSGSYTYPIFIFSSRKEFYP